MKEMTLFVRSRIMATKSQPSTDTSTIKKKEMMKMLGFLTCSLAFLEQKTVELIQDQETPEDEKSILRRDLMALKDL